MPIKITKDPLHLLHSDKTFISILDLSNQYLEDNNDIMDKINESNWILDYLSHLIPQTVENFSSGHIFPVTEAKYELECSIVFSKIGFYKHAISSLRNVLELGLLSVYWDIDDKSHIDIQNWVKSMEATPFIKQIFLKLQKNKNIKSFDNKKHIFDQTKRLYKRLSNFSHTKGFNHSGRKLNLHYSNVNIFTETSFKKWFEIMREVLKIITIFHVLKYPVALQYTPIDKKFGLNGPIGGFLLPPQTEKIKKLFDKETLKELQNISDNDNDAVSLSKYINEQIDVTKEEFQKQLETQDKMFIEISNGFEQWLKNEKKIWKYLKKTNLEEYKKKIKYFKILKKWAKKNNCYESKTEN